MIFLNLAPVDIWNSVMPNDGGRPGNFYAATHGRSKSFFILTAGEESLGHLQPNVYLVPSGTICTPHLKEKHATVMRDGYAASKKLVHDANIRLSLGEAVDAYAVRQPLHFSRLRDLFSHPATSRSVFVGHHEIGAGVEIQLDEYIVSKQQVLQEMVDFSLGRLRACGVNKLANR